MIESKKYKLSEGAKSYYEQLNSHVSKSKYKYLTNPCLTKRSWIHTSFGPRQIKGLIDKPFTAIVNNEKYKATGFWSTGIKEVFQVKTDKGYTLELTKNHKLLTILSKDRYNTKIGWKELKDLQVGNEINLQNQRGSSWEGYGSFDEGWILGQIVGDGSYNPEKYPTYLRFWGHTQEYLVELAKNIIIDLYPEVRSDFGDNNGYNQINDCSQVATKKLNQLCEKFIEISSKEFKTELESETSSLFIKGFLRGFFDADGSIQGNLTKGVSVRLAQSSLKKLYVVQRMLARIGIISKVYENRREAETRSLPNGKGGYSNYNCSADHELVISKDNIVIFNKEIGFHDLEKQTKLEDILELMVRKPNKETFYDKIISIESIGQEEVYDCTIDTVHCFDANGITSHNCGEITLRASGGYCIISDLVPFHCDTLEEVLESARLAARFLIRVNTMDSLYGDETKRTNRIGVCITGIHEFAYKFFGLGFNELLNPDWNKSFWQFIDKLRLQVETSANEYADELGVTRPHTYTSMKPSGSVSKLFALTEGAHLPSWVAYMRWVQFQNDDPLIQKYQDKGYPTYLCKNYPNMTRVGFPTVPAITKLGMGSLLVIANQATPEQQYQYLMLLEKHWLGEGNNQISYTLKFDKTKVSQQDFEDIVFKYQPQIRCCSVMPTVSEDELKSRYEYLPEESISESDLLNIISSINDPDMEQVLDVETLHCATGACPL
jgi:intein/homing endonuclease